VLGLDHIDRAFKTGRLTTAVQDRGIRIRS
jgi:hypothetical protein